MLMTRCGDKNASFGAGFSHLKLTVGGIRDENIPRDGGIEPKFEWEKLCWTLSVVLSCFDLVFITCTAG